jgi:hypothetical protein
MLTKFPRFNPEQSAYLAFMNYVKNDESIELLKCGKPSFTTTQIIEEIPTIHNNIKFTIIVKANLKIIYDEKINNFIYDGTELYYIYLKFDKYSLLAKMHETMYYENIYEFYYAFTESFKNIAYDNITYYIDEIIKNYIAKYNIFASEKIKEINQISEEIETSTYRCS